jgi:transposase-like protein
MTETLETVTKKKPEPTAEQAAAEELVRRAREQGLSLTGPDGLLKQLTKVVIETALDQELTEHLGHEKNTPAGNESGNVRNGSRPKTVLTEGTGQVGIEVPRDRDGTFEPQIVKKRQRRLSGVDEIILSLYAKGLTTGEISAHFAEIYGASVSKETVSRITDRVIEEMQSWQARPLETKRSTLRCSSMRSWSRSATGRSPTGPSTPRSESPSPGTKTSWACGPGPAGKALSSG